MKQYRIKVDSYNVYIHSDGYIEISDMHQAYETHIDALREIVNNYDSKFKKEENE